MKTNRRDFLKLAGLTAAAGVAGKAAVDALAAEKGKQGEAGPTSDKRWAMVIDIKRCLAEDGCTKCIDACNEEHNIPRFTTKDNQPDPKNEVKWIWKESFEHALHEAVHERTPEETKHAKIPVLCNHCDNPPCTRVCPTGATWKRETDGIVMMDWHRCIGCRYCMAACPYGSRSFNFKDPRPAIEGKQNKNFPTRQRGVVEKCTFCEERLGLGNNPVPACVEKCTAGALLFGDLRDPESPASKALADADHFTIRRKPALGTRPQVFYIVGGKVNEGRQA